MANEAIAAPAVRVRPALPEDAAAILELLARVAREAPLAALDSVPDDPAPFAAALRRTGEQGQVLLAEAAADGEPLGVVFVARGPGPARHTANVSLAVGEGSRRRGVGRLLLRAAADWAEERGVERLTAAVASGNGAALALFGACGFAVEGRRPGQLRLAGALYDEVLFGAASADLRPRRAADRRRAGIR